jgi:putative SOS response-associated peptidase YedK
VRYYFVCTAYEIGKKGTRLPKRVMVQTAEKLLQLKETRIVRPTLIAPVIMPGGELRDMSWGFRRKFKGAKGMISRTIVNSREDKLNSPMWRQSFREHRCLIPSLAFYEWVEGSGGKATPLRFTREDDGWLMIAGIWEEGENGPCFSMLTTEPTDQIRTLHDRMPAVLTESQIDSYLDGELETFGPSSEKLLYAAAANFLKPVKPPAVDDQGLLF